jgi:hypothetical protein
MKRSIRITSIRRDPINTSLLAQALIELVLYQQEQVQPEAKQPPIRKQKRKRS